MSELFLKLINMSICASWLVLAVLLLRVVLRKAPKWFSVLLWGLVAVRLICPFSMESIFSLIPSAQTVTPEIMTDATPALHTGIQSLNSALNPVVSEAFAPDPLVSMNPLQLWIPLAAAGWLTGVAAMLLYTAVSYLMLRRKVATAVRLEEHIYQSEYVSSPFVLGLFRPKIYLPFEMDGKNMACVVAHETAHIRRKDHWWKPLGFVLLALHWFNPLMWLGYILLCRDIELACDEKVIKGMDNTARADYTQALVACSIRHRSIAACPLAFGEVGVKQRIKSVLHYKKPAFWLIIASVVVCAAVAVCFLTDPASGTLNSIEGRDFEAATQKKTTVMVSDGVTSAYAGAADRESLQALYDLRISRKEISRDRSEDRDKSHTLHLNLSPQEKTQILTSYAPDTSIHFNADFTQVWVNDSVKPTFSYRVLEPEKAESAYHSVSNGRVSGGLKNYYKNPDGTWRLNGINYKYRLVISGRMPNAAVDSTFIYLSNLESIPFERAWRAAGLSSNAEDYFPVEEAVLVDWTSGTPANGSITGGSIITEDCNIETAVSRAILKWNSGDRFPGTDLRAVEAHTILATESRSGTPLTNHVNHIEETVVYVHYVYNRYSYSGGVPVSQAGTATPAMLVFTGNSEKGYVLKTFWEPKDGSSYAEELRSKFPGEIAEKVLSGEVDIVELEAQCLEKAMQMRS